jgi:hypothetical protein
MEALPQTKPIANDALATLGTGWAYVRPVIHEGQQAYAICSADGNLLAIATTREAAFGVIRQHDLEPVDAH